VSTQTIFKTAGSTSKHTDIALVQNAASTAAGDPVLGLTYNTSGLTAYYRLGATGTLTSISLATQTVTGAYSSGGFVKIDDTHAPGGYRFDIPAACIATAGECNIWFAGAPAGTAGNMETHQLKIIVTAADLYDATRLGLTALSTLAPLPRYTGTALSGANGNIGLAASTPAAQCEPGDIVILTGGTGAGQSNVVLSLAGAGGSTPVATVMQNWPTANPDNTSTYEIIKIGGLVPAAVTDFWSDTANPARGLTTPLVGGRLDANVGSVAGVVVQQSGSGTQNIGGP